MPEVEAHITGTVWKIEVEVGDSVEEGDTVVILESMKMEMPVEAEDPGVVKEILLRGGAVGFRGRHARCPRVAPKRPAPHGGRLLVDEPAPGVARLTISNPGKRGALDHAILDGFASMMPPLDARCVIVTGEETTFSAGYDIGDLRDRVFADEAEKLVAHPFTAAIDAIEAYPYPTLAALNGHAIGGGLELAISCDLRIAAATIALGMPPAKLGLVYSHTGIRKFIDTIGVAAHAGAVPRRPSDRRPHGARRGASSTRSPRPDDLADEALALAVEIAGNAPLAQLGNKRVIRAVLDARGELAPEVERELIELRQACFSSEDFREGRAGVRREAPAGVEGALSRGARGGGVCPPRSSVRAGTVACSAMPPLITPEEALRLGELEDHDEIEALVERAWRVRVERFADSTDMCSLVNAKSGGCAEDCGFCAQSKYAEADTPMHAMMEPEQILEHARAAEAAGAHRFCMVTQGQGLSKRDFEKVLDGRAARRRAHEPQALRVDRPHVRRAGEGAQAGRDPARAPQRRDGRVLLPGGLDDRPLRGAAAHDRRGSRGGARDVRRRHPQPRRDARAAGRDGVRAGRDQPHERPDQPAQPAPGDEVRRPRADGPVGGRQVDRDLPPDPARGAVPAVRRPRREPRRAAGDGGQGRPQRRDDGQLPDDARQHARRGPRDVRGARTQRRAPADNGANPRPDNRTAGSTARRRTSSRRRSTLHPPGPIAPNGLDVRLWDPSEQLRFSRKRPVPPRPDGAPNTATGAMQRTGPADRGAPALRSSSLIADARRTTPDAAPTRHARPYAPAGAGAAPPRPSPPPPRHRPDPSGIRRPA